MSGSNPFLGIESLNVTLGDFSLKDLAFSCAKGEYHILLGPTGSGKSSLLKCILGIHRPESGRIHLDGVDVTDELPEHRQMGYVPQNYALFPHLNVEENLRFGLRPRKVPAKQADSLVDRLSEVLNIEHLRKRSIQHLSGGEKQKVAIGRALATQPKMMLLDEPFSNLDPISRTTARNDLRSRHNEDRITTIYVTHNLDDAFALADRVAVMNEGRIVQVGTPDEIRGRPANALVRALIESR